MEYIAIGFELAITGLTVVSLDAFVSAKLNYCGRAAVFAGYGFCCYFFYCHFSPLPLAYHSTTQ
jgi:hypothetical protein